MKKPNIIILTQADSFFIPTNIKKLIPICNIKNIIEVNSSGALKNKIKDYFKWFGVIQCFKFGCLVIYKKFQTIIDKLFKYKLFNGTTSIKNIALANQINFQCINNINSDNFINSIKDEKIDLIISFSLPQKIKDPLLSLPKYGILNLHGALLPNYKGCLPSFWYLYNNEKLGGTTLHLINSEIDEGSILAQSSVNIDDCVSIYEVVKKTKTIGGDLLVNWLLKFIKHPKSTINDCLDIDNSKGTYYTFPTTEQARQFRKLGKKLI